MRLVLQIIFRTRDAEVFRSQRPSGPLFRGTLPVLIIFLCVEPIMRNYSLPVSKIPNKPFLIESNLFLSIFQQNQKQLKTKHARRYAENRRDTEVFRGQRPSGFLDEVYGSICTEFQVCIVFLLAGRRDTNTYTTTYTHIQVKI